MGISFMISWREVYLPSIERSIVKTHTLLSYIQIVRAFSKVGGVGTFPTTIFTKL